MIASAPKWNKLDDVERIVVLSSVSHGLFGGIEGPLLSYLFDCLLTSCPDRKPCRQPSDTADYAGIKQRKHHQME